MCHNVETPVLLRMTQPNKFEAPPAAFDTPVASLDVPQVEVAPVTAPVESAPEKSAAEAPKTAEKPAPQASSSNTPYTLDRTPSPKAGAPSPSSAQAAPEEAPEADNSFADILSEFEHTHQTRGETMEGTVVSVTPESVFVDLGRKMDGVLPANPSAQVEARPEADRQHSGPRRRGQLSALHDQGRDPARLDGARSRVRVQGDHLRPRARSGEGRRARRRRRARVHACLAQRRSRSRRYGEAGRPGYRMPHHQARYGVGRCRGRSPRGSRRAREGRQAGNFRASGGRRGGARHRPHRDRVRRVRRSGRHRRPAARFRHELVARREALRRGRAGAARRGQDPQDQSRKPQDLAGPEATSAGSVDRWPRRSTNPARASRARFRACSISARSSNWSPASKA